MTDTSNAHIAKQMPRRTRQNFQTTSDSWYVKPDQRSIISDWYDHTKQFQYVR